MGAWLHCTKRSTPRQLHGNGIVILAIERRNAILQL